MYVECLHGMGIVLIRGVPGDHASSPGFVYMIEQQGACLGKSAIVMEHRHQKSQSTNVIL